MTSRRLAARVLLLAGLVLLVAAGVWLAAANRSGGEPVAFDAAGPLDGLESLRLPISVTPTIDATPTEGLRDGEPIEVVGANFDPGAQVIVTQCPAGGLDDASDGCVALNPGEIVDIGVEGGFSVTITASRQRESHEGPHDCALDLHGCMLVVRPATQPARSPNPVPLAFDASVVPPLPPEYTVTPSQGLVEGDVVRLEVFDMPVDGSFGVRQCADGGPRGLFCEPRGVIEVTAGAGAADLIVVGTLTLGDDLVDCTQPARRCYLTLDGELGDLVRGPLRFAS